MPEYVESGHPQPTEELTPTCPPQEVHDRYPELQERFQELIGKIRVRFGDQSGVMVHIVHMTRLFAAQKVTKREAYASINSKLENDLELQQHFQAMFCHPDASWAPSDFEPSPEMPKLLLPEQDSPNLSQPELMSKCSPQTPESLRLEQGPIEAVQHGSLTANVPKLPEPLQSERTPQTTLPSLRSWFNTSPRLSSINPSLLTERFVAGEGSKRTTEHDSTQRMPQPSFAAIHEHEHTYLSTYADVHLPPPEAQPLAELALDDPSHGHSQYALHLPQQAYLAPLANSSNAADHTSPIFCGSDPQLQPSHAGNHTDNLIPGNHGLTQDSGMGDDCNRRQNFPTDWIRYGATAPLASPNQPSLFTAPPAVTCSGMSDSQGHSIGISSPLQTLNTGYNPYDQNVDNGVYRQNGSGQQDYATAHVRPNSSHRLPSPYAENLESISSHLSTKFIHSLCGKSFGTRHGVKKHHWGAKLNDLNTETGCWAKHGKPNVAWDDHPSCKDTTAKTNKSKGLGLRSQPTEGEGLVPSIAPLQSVKQSESLLGSPMVHSIPRVVDKSFQPRQSPNLSSHGAMEGLDALVTVVNAASTLDACIPQGRNDSLISQSDTQIPALHTDIQSLLGQNVLASGEVAQYYVTPRAYRNIAPALMNDFYIPQHSFAQQVSLDSMAVAFRDEVGKDGYDRSSFASVGQADETPIRALKKGRLSSTDTPMMSTKSSVSQD